MKKSGATENSPAFAGEKSLSRQMQMLETLSRSICHEFNNALGGMQGYAQLALRNPDDITLTKRALDVTVRASQRMTEMTRRLSHFAYAQKDTPFERGDLIVLVQDCIQLLRPLMSQQRIDLLLDLDYSSEINHHRAHFRVALMEILSNAIDAAACCENGQRQIKVHLSAGAKGWVELVFEDNGPGIDEAIIDRITDPFFSTRDILAGGEDPKTRGLGLALATSIVRDHGGEILFKSQVGLQGTTKGTQVTLRLPQADDNNVIRKRVMIVDDEVSIQRIFDKFIRMAGYETIPLASAEDALEVLTSDVSVDMILLDQMMPGMSGLDLLARMQDEGISIPVMMITASHNLQEARQALALGAIAVEFKPVNRERMIFLLDCHLRRIEAGVTLSRVACREVIGEQILLVDGDRLTRDLICLALEQCGYRVTTCDAISAAERATESEYYDLILLDPLLHDITKKQAVKVLRLNNPYTPIFVLSDVSTRELSERAVREGATRTIEKPLDIQNLLNEIHGVMEIFRKRL